MSSMQKTCCPRRHLSPVQLRGSLAKPCSCLQVHARSAKACRLRRPSRPSSTSGGRSVNLTALLSALSMNINAPDSVTDVYRATKVLECSDQCTVVKNRLGRPLLGLPDVWATMGMVTRKKEILGLLPASMGLWML